MPSTSRPSQALPAPEAAGEPRPDSAATEDHARRTASRPSVTLAREGRGRRFGPTLEAGLALAAGWVVSLLMHAPVLHHPASAVSTDVGDPLFQAWQVAWDGHALTSQPGHVFDANIFWPLPHSLAFSDSLLGYAPFGLLGHGPGAALVRYNLLWLGAYALAFAGTYLLARQLGCRRGGAGVAGLAFAYAPWHIAQSGHLNIMSTGGIPLALALLARGHGVGGRTGAAPLRAWAVVAGWAVAAWQVSLGFGIGLPFAYLLGVITLVGVVTAALARRRTGSWPGSRRLLGAELAGMALFAVTAGLLALPYLQAVRDQPQARRNETALALYSPPLTGFVTTPAEDRLWGPHQEQARKELPFDPEDTLAVGATLVVLAVGGIARGRWSPRRRAVLAATALGTLLLAMGTQAPFGGRLSYLVLLHHAPGWDAIRTPGRLVVPLTLALALLAATGTDALLAAVARPTDGGRHRDPGVSPRAVRVSVAATLAVLVLVEGLDTLAHPSPEPYPTALAGLPAPLFVLPSSDLADDTNEWWSTRDLPATANGSAAFVPAELGQLRDGTHDFPDTASVGLLRSRGIRTVVVDRQRVGGTPWAGAANRPVDGLPLDRRETGSLVIFSLSP